LGLFGHKPFARVTVRFRTPRPDPVRVPRFTTNPVFVDVDGNGAFDAPGDKTCSYPRG
jgi:hypothetical protein